MKRLFYIAVLVLAASSAWGANLILFENFDDQDYDQGTFGTFSESSGDSTNAYDAGATWESDGSGGYCRSERIYSAGKSSGPSYPVRPRFVPGQQWPTNYVFYRYKIRFPLWSDDGVHQSNLKYIRLYKASDKAYWHSAAQSYHAAYVLFNVNSNDNNPDDQDIAYFVMSNIANGSWHTIAYLFNLTNGNGKIWYDRDPVTQTPTAEIQPGYFDWPAGDREFSYIVGPADDGHDDYVDYIRQYDDVEIWDGLPGTSSNFPPSVDITTPSGSTITTDSKSVAGNATDSDGSVSGCWWKVGSQATASDTACSGTNPFTCNTSGYSNGANTLYVGCRDNDSAWNQDSIVVNYDLAPQSDVVSITATDETANEYGDTGTFQFSRDGSSGDLTVYFTLTGAASADDYSEDLSGGSITIPDGSTYYDQTITPILDVDSEDEVLVITLTDTPASYILGSPITASVTIQDATPLPAVLKRVAFSGGNIAPGWVFPTTDPPLDDVYNTYTGSPNVFGQYFISSTLTADNMDGVSNDLTESSDGDAATADEGRRIIGTYSALFDSDDYSRYQTFKIATGNWISSESDYSITGWFYLSSGADRNSQTVLFSKWNTSSQRSFAVLIDDDLGNIYNEYTGTPYPRGIYIIHATSGTTWDSLFLAPYSLSIGRWYFLHYTYDDSENTHRIRLWDRTSQEWVSGSPFSEDATGDMYWGTANLAFANYDSSSASRQFDGHQNEMVVWDKVVSDEDADEIRDGTFVYTETPVSCSSGTSCGAYCSHDTSGFSTLAVAPNAIPQSFQVSSTGSLYSISVESGAATAGANIEIRIGTSRNLTTYIDRIVINGINGETFAEGVSSTNPTLNSGTTYYMGVVVTSGTFRWLRDEFGSPTYAYGTAYVPGTGWDFSASSTYNADYSFIIKLCD